MSPNVTHLAIAVALLAAPASLGVATQTDALDELDVLAPTAGPDDGAQTVDTFTGEVPADVTAGNLDLRIDRGAVQVVGWAQDAYKLEVRESGADGSLSQGETDTEFQETVENGTVSLSLVVDHREPASTEVRAAGESAGDNGERAIVAYVPQRLTYEQVHACEGESASATDVDLVSADGDEACVETDHPTAVHGTITAHGGDDGLEVGWGLQSLEGEQATLEADDGEVALDQLDFGAVEVTTDNGDVRGGNLTVADLAVATDNGAIDLDVDADEARLATDNGKIVAKGAIASLEATSDNGQIDVSSSVLHNGSIATDNGAIEVFAHPSASGELTLTSQNGPVDAVLGHAETVGYAAEGWTENGEVDITLADEQGEGEAPAPEEHRYDDHESAKSAGYEDKPVQLAITAHSENGNVEINEENVMTTEGYEENEETVSLDRVP